MVKYFRSFKSLIMVLVVFMILLGFSFSVYADGVIFYESFEDPDLDGWSGPGVHGTGEAFGGKGSLLIVDDSESAYMNVTSPFIEVDPSGTYTISAWAKGDGGRGGGRIGICIYEKDSNKGGSRPAHWLWFEQGVNWTSASLTVTLQPTTHFLQMNLYPAAANGVDKKGRAWFDEIEVIVGAVAEEVVEVEGTPILKNAFGEPIPVEDVVDIGEELAPEEFWNMIEAPSYSRTSKSPWEIPLIRSYFFGVNANAVKSAENLDILPEASGMLGKPLQAPKVVAKDIKYRPILTGHGDYSNKYYPRCMEGNAEVYKDAYILVGNDKYYKRMEELLGYLLYAQYKADGSNGFVRDNYPEDHKHIIETGLGEKWRGGWDYLFDWEWLDGYGYQWSLHEPDHHVNSRAARTMVRGYEVTGKEEYMKAAWEFVYYQVPRYGFHTGIWEGERYYWTEYNPSGPGNPIEDATDNIQACVALATAMVGYYYEDARMLEFSRGLLWYLVREFETDGQWYYDGAENPRNQRRAPSPGHQIWTLTHPLEAMPYLIAGGVPLGNIIPTFEKALKWYTDNYDEMAYRRGVRGYDLVETMGRNQAKVTTYLLVTDDIKELTLLKGVYAKREKDGSVIVRLTKMGTEEKPLELKIKPSGFGKLVNLRIKIPFQPQMGDIYRIEYECTNEGVYLPKGTRYEARAGEGTIKTGSFSFIPSGLQVNADNFLDFPGKLYFPLR